MSTLRSILASIFFGVLTILLSILSVPAAALDRSGRAYLTLARLWSKSFLWLYGIRVHVEGSIPVDKSGKIYIVNHSSYVDIPVVLASIKDDIRIVLRRSLTRVPVWGWALAVSPFITIDNTSGVAAQESIEAASRTIQDGASVLLFPEGTRTADGAMRPFKRGAFRLAFTSRSMIVPVAILGTYDVLDRRHSMPRSNMTVTLRIGEAITQLKSDARPREQEIALMKQSEEALRQLLTD